MSQPKMGAEPPKSLKAQMTMTLAELIRTSLTIETKLKLLQDEIQVMAEHITQMEEDDPHDLGTGSISTPLFTTASACQVLTERTGYRWTHAKMLTLAKAKGWRAGYQPYNPIASLWCQLINSKVYTNGVICYTRRALEYIIDNKEECWSIASGNKSQHAPGSFKYANI